MATAQEIVKKGMVAVRNSATLYPQYQELFKEAFEYYPECPTCGSLLGQNQWRAFEAFANGANPNNLLTSKTLDTMSETTFKIKDKSLIYSYNFKKKGQDRDFTNRTYGDLMTEEFAVAYLDAAKDNAELLEERKAQFSLLPAKYSDSNSDTDDKGTDLTKLKLVDLQKIATDKAYPADEWDKIKSKADLIAYLEAKSLNDGADSSKPGGDDDSLI